MGRVGLQVELGMLYGEWMWLLQSCMDAKTLVYITLGAKLLWDWAIGLLGFVGFIQQKWRERENYENWKLRRRMSEMHQTISFSARELQRKLQRVWILEVCKNMFREQWPWCRTCCDMLVNGLSMACQWLVKVANCSCRFLSCAAWHKLVADTAKGATSLYDGTAERKHRLLLYVVWQWYGHLWILAGLQWPTAALVALYADIESLPCETDPKVKNNIKRIDRRVR